MAHCVRNGYSYKQHNFDEHGKCKGCGQKRKTPIRVSPNSYERRRKRLRELRRVV